MSVLMIAKFAGDPETLRAAYDKADSALEAKLGTRMPPGATHHVCAISDDALFVVDVWESEETLRGMLQAPEFVDTVMAAGFPSPTDADIQIFPIHAELPAS